MKALLKTEKYFFDKETNKYISYDEAVKQNKLYRCCNSCKYMDYYGKCCNSHICENGFSSYEPNNDIIKQERVKI